MINGTPVQPGTFAVAVMGLNSIGESEHQYVLEVAPAAGAPDPLPSPDPAPDSNDAAGDSNDAAGDSDEAADQAPDDLPVTGTPSPLPAIAIALALTLMGSMLVVNRVRQRT